MTDARICIGKIVAAQGIKGHLKVHSFTENPRSIVDYGDITDETGNPFPFTLISAKKNTAIITIEGITDRNQAETLIGTTLYICPSHLPTTEENEFYAHELQGLSTKDAEGTVIGTVKDIHNFGADDIIEITLSNGKDEMLPFTHQVIPEINLEEGYLTIVMPEIIIVQN